MPIIITKGVVGINQQASALFIFKCQSGSLWRLSIMEKEYLKPEVKVYSVHLRAGITTSGSASDFDGDDDWTQSPNNG